MDKELTRYLNDHLAGSTGALLLIQKLADWVPEWHGIDFVALERQAIQQRDDIEFWRIQAAISILAGGERRHGTSALNLQC